MADLLIQTRDIKKSYLSGGTPVHALKGVSLEVFQGEAVAVVGQSGSGKSTLLSIIGALNPPSEGEIFIDGISLYGLSQERRADFRREYLGFVFQQFQLIPYLTALENVLLPLTTTRYPGRQKREMAVQALEKVGMEEKPNRLPNQLSGGEQERVAIARAIVNEPPLLLADEPTGSLDTHTAEEIMNLFTSLNKAGLTILMVTHNLQYTAYMARTITMQDGRLANDEMAAVAAAGGAAAFGKGGKAR